MILSKFKLSVICLIMLSVYIFSCSQDKKPEAETNNNNSRSENKNHKLPKLLDIGAKSCIPCKMMEPVLEELTREYKGIFDVEFVDVWIPENKQIAYKYNIKTIPTQIFFDTRGKEIWRHIGFISKEDILQKWKSFGYDFEAEKKEKSDN